LRLRFNQLPQKDMIRFLTHISTNEKLAFSQETLSMIQQLYGSDMRSMINFMQSNQHMNDKTIIIINTTIWKTLFQLFQKNEAVTKIDSYLHEISITHNIDKKNMIQSFLNYTIRTKIHVITED